ncbi:MAG: hypothetical protein AAGN82_27545, partial [Myxococcota bacterium]
PPPPPPSPEEETSRHRQSVVRTLAEARPTPTADFEAQMRRALGDAAHVPPAVVAEGTLRLDLDPATELKVTVLVAAPMAKANRGLADAVSRAREAEPTVAVAPTMAAPLRRQIHEAWKKANLGLPASFLESTVAQALLEQRAFVRRPVLGATFVRAALTADDEQAPPAVVYLPDDAATNLPLFTAFPVRLLARLVPKQDQRETAAVALHTLALARTGI